MGLVLPLLLGRNLAFLLALWMNINRQKSRLNFLFQGLKYEKFQMSKVYFSSCYWLVKVIFRFVQTFWDLDEGASPLWNMLFCSKKSSRNFFLIVAWNVSVGSEKISEMVRSLALFPQVQKDRRAKRHRPERRREPLLGCFHCNAMKQL